MLNKFTIKYDIKFYIYFQLQQLECREKIFITYGVNSPIQECFLSVHEYDG